MANRIVMDGQNFKISKPGVDVLTTGESGLILDKDIPLLQIIDSGVFTSVPSGQTRTINIPSVGFIPVIHTYSPTNVVKVSYSGSSATLSSAYGGTSNIHWAILNIPRG